MVELALLLSVRSRLQMMWGDFFLAAKQVIEAAWKQVR
jgi:hypothetical protein